MNEPTTKGGPEHEIKPSENKEVETEAGDADLLSTGKNNVEKQSSQLSEEAELTGKSGSVFTSAEHNMADKLDKANDLPLEEETSEAPLQKETDDQVTELMLGNTSSVYLSAENIFDNKYDNGKHMTLEKQSDSTPMEEKSDVAHTEKQIGDYTTAPITYDSEPVGSSAQNNLSEKSVNITLLEKQTDYTPEEEKTDEIHLKEQMDDCITVLTTDNYNTNNTSLEHSPFEKSEKADVPLTKKIDGPSSEKEADDTTLANQTNHQVTEPITVCSGSFLAFSECNASDKSSKTDEISLDMQIDGSPLPDKLDKIAEAPLVMEDKGIVLPENLNKTDKTSPEIQNDGTPIEKTADETLVERTDHQVSGPVTNMEIDSGQGEASNIKIRDANDLAVPLENKIASAEANLKEPHPEDNHTETPLKVGSVGGEFLTHMEGSNQSFTFEPYVDGDDSGSEEEQAAFMKELENFHRERNLEYKPPKFYGEPLNCLKLWRTVTRLGGYDQVTVCKLWRQVGESFKPPKTCTTVSWSFRNFYEKALFAYEKHKIQTGELKSSVVNLPGVVSDDNQVSGSQGSGSGRVRRDAAARAMQVWHNQRLLDTGEDKNILPLEEGQLISTGKLKKRKSSNLEHYGKVMKIDPVKPQENIAVADVGAPADWVKINVQRTNEFFEVYALVPGLLREEVQVQSDPAGRLIISGEPEHPDNPWGVTPFKKVITLPTRIDPYQTSAVVTLHGQLFVRAPIDRSDV